MREWTVEFTDSDRPILNRHDGTGPVTYPKEFTQALKETVRAHNATLQPARERAGEMNTRQIAEELDESLREICIVDKAFRKDFHGRIQSAIDQVRTETLAECRAATEQQICDLQDRAAHASEPWHPASEPPKPEDFEPTGQVLCVMDAARQRNSR